MNGLKEEVSKPSNRHGTSNNHLARKIKFVSLLHLPNSLLPFNAVPRFHSIPIHGLGRTYGHGESPLIPDKSPSDQGEYRVAPAITAIRSDPTTTVHRLLER